MIRWKDRPAPARSRQPSRFRTTLIPLAVTGAIFAVILQRIPLDRLARALAVADHARFLAWMIPNTLVYFCWDTLILTVAISWFHGDARYRDLLPVRASSYVVAFFNTNAGRGALAAYLSRRLGAPFLQLGSTVLFLVLTEYVHLAAWATLGVLTIRAHGATEVGSEVLWAVPGVAALWLAAFLLRRARAVPDWSLLRTFRLAPPRRYGQIIGLRAPMFFASLMFHYLAAPAFDLEIPFWAMVAFLPVIFMIAALPITVAHLGTTQAAWLFFFGPYGPAESILAFSLAAHLTFMATRTLIGLVFLPRALGDLVRGSGVQRFIG